MNEKIIYDIFEWDVSNWSKGLEYWDDVLTNLKGKKVLTIGEKNAGLTLLFASKGAFVTSTDLEGVTQEGKEKIERYGLTDKVTFDEADFTKLKFKDNTFDIVTFKSVLGGLRTKENQIKALSEAARVLKEGGFLVFAENMKASGLHTFLRKKFLPWGGYWRYLDYNELNEMFKPFESRDFYFHGFWGTFGRSEKQRNILAAFDKIICRFLPPRFKYILFGICKIKRENYAGN